MKLLKCFIFLITLSTYLFGNSPYTLKTRIEDYSELNNANSINTNNTWNENSSFVLDFNFNFIIDGKPYTSLNVKSGAIEFAGIGEIRLWVFPYILKDRGISGSLSPICYTIDGSENKRILKIEWKNAGFTQFFTSSSLNDYVNFQIWLFEEDNHIEIHFGESNTDGGTFGYPQDNSATGPSIKFKCSSDSALIPYGVADNPSFGWYSISSVYYDRYLNSTPSKNMVYEIVPYSITDNENTINYGFKKGSDSYIPLLSPVLLTNSEIWNSTLNYTIDFDFRVYDKAYTKINVISGGGITFSGEDEKQLYIYHTVFGGYMLQSKGDTVAKSSICYEIVGPEKKHILKIQWANAGFVQWYTTSDTADFANFQIWLYEEDYHIEIHFGENFTDPGTYGYPDGTSDSDPGTGIMFLFNDCSSMLCISGTADNPSYDFLNFCSPNQRFIDGTPSSGIIYNITTDYVSTEIKKEAIHPLTVYPNPIESEFFVNNDKVIDQIRIYNINGEIIYFQRNTGQTQLRIQLGNIKSGLYLIEISDQDKCRTYKLIK
jgi:hypothetical protein